MGWKWLFCCGPEKTKHNEVQSIENQLLKAAHTYNISILPVVANYNIDNLYPSTNQVHLWNTFVVGNDKTYILANIKDLGLLTDNEKNDQDSVSGRLLNNRSYSILPSALSQFMDTIWDYTLGGQQMQFFMLWNARLFFTNTYPLQNTHSKVIGAVMFMRAFDSLPKTEYQDMNYDNLSSSLSNIHAVLVNLGESRGAGTL